MYKKYITKIRKIIKENISIDYKNRRKKYFIKIIMKKKENKLL
jgi:hypothetical protein